MPGAAPLQQGLRLRVTEVSGLVFFVNDIQSLLEVAGDRAVLAAVSLFWRAHLWRRAAYNPNTLRLRVKLGGAHFDLTLSRRVCPWVVCEVDVGRLETRDVAHERADMYLWVRLDDLNLVFEVHWAVTLNLERLLVGLAY